MLFQQRPLVLFHHGSQLLQITDQQQLHPTERLVLGAVTTQHIIHPNDNRATVVIPREEFMRYLAAVGNSFEFIDLY